MQHMNLDNIELSKTGKGKRRIQNRAKFDNNILYSCTNVFGLLFDTSETLFVLIIVLLTVIRSVCDVLLCNFQNKILNSNIY